jgi:hypothetical protein
LVSSLIENTPQLIRFVREKIVPCAHAQNSGKSRLTLLIRRQFVQTAFTRRIVRRVNELPLSVGTTIREVRVAAVTATYCRFVHAFKVCEQPSKRWKNRFRKRALSFDCRPR